jgi:hypothetical protein
MGAKLFLTMVNTEQIAKTCHEVNRAYCESIGDMSQPAWENAPDWQKKSAVQGVKFYIGDSKATPEQMHENWSRVKVEDGWVYGEIKDAEAKTHPCLVPYDKLPAAQQVKDSLFIAVIRSMI